MDTIAHLARTLKELLTTTADRIARETGFVQRVSKMTGSLFSQTLVAGWLSNAEATDEELAQTAMTVGVSITPQGLEARFTRQACEFMRTLLEEAVTHLVAVQPVNVSLLQRFNGVYIQDSTTITLPDELADVWHGSGENSSNPVVAGMKVQVQFDYSGGLLSHLSLQDGCAQDRDAAVQTAPLPAGALRLSDLGYFNLPVFAELAAANGYWLSRAQVNTQCGTSDGQWHDQVTLLSHCHEAQFEQTILLGKEQRVPCRLLAAKVPPEVASRRRQELHKEARHKGQTVSQARLALADWTVLVTNVPVELLSCEEALVLMGCRWQIELLFKLWKSHGQVDTSRSHNPWRILCEVYAKLLAMVVQHWLFIVCNWSVYDRSLVKAAQTIRRHALHLAAHFRSPAEMAEVIELMRSCLQSGCRIHRSKAAPRTFQRLAEFDEKLPDTPTGTRQQESRSRELVAAF